jgi:hypothetical protein
MAAIRQSELDFLLASEGLSADSLAKLLAAGYYTLRRFAIMGDDRPSVRTVLKDKVLSLLDGGREAFHPADQGLGVGRSRRSPRAALKSQTSRACARLSLLGSGVLPNLISQAVAISTAC